MADEDLQSQSFILSSPFHARSLSVVSASGPVTALRRHSFHIKLSSKFENNTHDDSLEDITDLRCNSLIGALSDVFLSRYFC